MLRWVAKEVESPFGDIATMHWAVGAEGEEEKQEGGNDKRGNGSSVSRKRGRNDVQHREEELELQRLLGDAEDQLGAVLWNSNSVAMKYLQKHFFENRVGECRVVELGAGVGCLGIGLAMAGARVVVTDLKELVPLMQKNIELNRERIRSRSNGKGSCFATTWRWGPPPRQKRKIQGDKEAVGGKTRRTSSGEKIPSTSSQNDCSPYHQPSDPFVEVQRWLDRVDLVVLCDALYGNPKSWPQLLYTLSEILAANLHCEVINFCEQRVKDVEGEFLNLLKRENARAISSAGYAVEPTEEETLDDALLRMRGPYDWLASTGVVSEGLSDLGERIHVTRISWVQRNEECGANTSTT